MSELTQKLHALNMEKEPIVRELRARIGELEKETAPFRDPYFKGLSMEAIAELAKKSIRLTEQHNKDTERIGELEDTLKESISYLQLQGKYHSEPIKRFQQQLLS